MKSFTLQTLKLMTMLCLSLFVFGCGGGGSGGSSSTSTTSVSGSVLAGPASGTVVIVKSAGVEVARSGASAAEGSFTVTIPTSELSKDLVFETSGGSFPDEATSTSGVAMGTLNAYVSGATLTAGSNVTIDPSSTIVQKLVAGGKTKTAADTVFATAFGYTPDCSVKPAFATISSASSTNQRLTGLRAAAFSQLTKDLGLTPAKQFELIQALADDLSDGVLDGKKAGVAVSTASGTPIPEDIGNRFVAALVAFQASALNKCKLTSDKIGVLPFNKTALTTSYKVEYIPGTMAAAMGKTTFKIKLSNRDNTPAAGKAVTLFPYMYMATKSHTTPTDPVVVDNGDGTYSCTAYYVMSTMMNSVSMGVWQLKVSISNETAYFYPSIGMPMGTTTLTKLTGINDSISSFAGPEKRTYFLFSDGLTAGAGGSYTFGLFLATKENMMSFPAVMVGSQLVDQTGTVKPVNTISVQVSTDGITWVSATDSGNSHWSAAGLTGLLSGVSGKTYVKVTVNGEQKTTDGSLLSVSGTNGYQTFTVIP